MSSFSSKPQNTTWLSSLLQHSFNQFFIGLLLIVFVPLLFAPSYWHATTVINSSTANFIAFFASFLFLRKLRYYPGSYGIRTALPIVLTAWLLVFSFFLITRLNYSRPVLLSAYVFASFWAVLIYRFQASNSLQTFALIPFGKAETLQKHSSLVLKELKQPSLDGLKCDGIIVDLYAQDLDADWEKFLARCALAKIPVFHYKQLEEALTGRVSIEHLSENVFGNLQPSTTVSLLKRLFDLLLTLLALPLWLPVMLITGLIIKLESQGPIFFTQQRIGQWGKPYTVYKLRSMTTDSEKNGAQFAQANDARITRVGHFIRKTRIDELPQFINVLMGNMSIIGPRPEQQQFVEQFEEEIPFYSYRHIVKPGITGWAQVTQGYADDKDSTKIKLEYDLYYIKNFSAWLDLLIVIKTIRTILTGFGAR